jgi:hypothetical protein
VSLDTYLEAWTQLAIAEREVDERFERRRLALCPVAPGPAPPIGQGVTEIDGEPVRPGGKLTLCTLANAVGLPAAAVPVLRTADGLPVGVQVIGGRGRDHEVIAAARAIEDAYGGLHRSLSPHASRRTASRRPNAGCSSSREAALPWRRDRFRHRRAQWHGTRNAPGRASPCGDPARPIFGHMAKAAAADGAIIRRACDWRRTGWRLRIS